MTNIAISSTPFQVVGQQVFGQDMTIQNSGSYSVYLSQNPGVSPTNYEYKIDPGGDWSWTSGKPLYVCTSPGVQGQISYGNNTQMRLNSGSSLVTPIQRYTPIINYPGPLVGAAPRILNGVDVSALASIVFTLGSGGNPSMTLSTAALQIDWITPDGTLVLARERFDFWQTGFAFYTTTVKSARMTVYYISSNDGVDQIFPVMIQGSTILLPSTYDQNVPLNSLVINCAINTRVFNLGADIGSISVTIPASTQATIVLPSKAGIANVNIDAGTTTAATLANLTYRLGYGVIAIANSAIAIRIPTTQNTNVEARLGSTPIALYINNANLTPITIVTTLTFTPTH